MRTTLIAGFITAFALPVLAEDITIDTAAGDVTLPATPEKIAVFDIPALDTLTALGVSVAGVPEKIYVPYLQPVRDAATPIGTLFEPNFEELAVMAPDAIIAGGRSSDQVGALSKIAPTVDMTIGTDSIIDIAKARVATYGALFDRDEAATTLNATIDAKLSEAQAAVDGKGNALIIMTNGAKISAYGAESRFGWLHQAVGLPLASADLEADTHGKAISFEFVAQTNPDWILVVDRGAAIGQSEGAAQATLDNEIIKGTEAAQAGQIVYLDSAPLYIAGGGAGSVLHTLEEIVAAFGNGNS